MKITWSRSIVLDCVSVSDVVLVVTVPVVVTVTVESVFVFVAEVSVTVCVSVGSVVVGTQLLQSSGQSF